MRVQVKTTNFKKITKWEIKDLDNKVVLAAGSSDNEDTAIEDIETILDRYPNTLTALTVENEVTSD